MLPEAEIWVIPTTIQAPRSLWFRARRICAPNHFTSLAMSSEYVNTPAPSKDGAVNAPTSTEVAITNTIAPPIVVRPIVEIIDSSKSSDTTSSECTIFFSVLMNISLSTHIDSGEIVDLRQVGPDNTPRQGSTPNQSDPKNVNPTKGECF